MKQWMKPKWTHDCKKCEYLGSMFLGRGLADWYECKGSDPSIIARFGDDGPDYWSMPKDMALDARYLTTQDVDGNPGYSEMSVLAQFFVSQATKGETE